MWNREAVSKNDAPQQSQTTEPAIASRPLDERRVVAWVGKSVVFKGDLISLEDMIIDGRVEGTIGLGDHGLTIGPDADIRADIVAKRVTVRGAVTGTITASDKVDICETASINGDIISPRLAVAEGAMLRGRVDTFDRHADAETPPPPRGSIV